MEESGALTERQAFLVLNALPNIGPVVLNRILADLGGSPRSVFTTGAERLEAVRGVGPATSEALVNWRKYFDLAREEAGLERNDADVLIAQDEIYPELLREISDPPIALYRKGSYRFDNPCIAIVGSRRTTLYGQAVAKKLGGEFAQAGFCVVSGLARGIDTAAHEGALDAGGKTVAVLGTGIDIVFPLENGKLCRRIAENGAVLSEFPLGRPGDRQSFPMRNRIVSGMSSAVIVVESDVNGGAMITARFAGEQGRSVFAVPGRIDQSTSAGCHQLIRDGAALFTCIDDVFSDLSYLDGLRPAAIPPKAGSKSAATGLAVDELALMARFNGGSILTADALAEQTGIPAAQVSVTLMMLELKQLVAKRMDGAYEATS